MAATTDRAPLNRERIVNAAVSFADEHGLEELSMRKLGAALGVEAMSLYNHVEDKGDLFDGMIDHVFSSISLPGDERGWKERLRLIGAAAMDQFIRHPWVVALLMQRGTTGPGALAFMDHVLGILTHAGFDDEDIHHAWQMLASHTTGYAFQQATSVGFVKADMVDVEVQLARIAHQFPHVARIAPLLAECEFRTEHLFGLEIILDGLETRLGASGVASASPTDGQPPPTSADG